MPDDMRTVETRRARVAIEDAVETLVEWGETREEIRDYLLEALEMALEREGTGL